MELMQSSERTISVKWLENIFQSLMKLETYERLLKEGCDNILEYVTNQNISIADIQNKNYRLFISELEIILSNTKHIIPKENYLEIYMLLKSIKEKEEKLNGFLSKNWDAVQKTEWNEMKPEFNSIIPKISTIRSLLVSSLWQLLSPSAKENIDGLPI